MSEAAKPYRWNSSQAAEAFDQAAEFIHPYYLAVQDQILDHLPFAHDAAFLIVDLGGGSGRLIERFFDRFANARAVLVDQSEPFLALAERRLQPFGPRAKLVQRRLQEDWTAALPAAPNAIVSMSAIHHLDGAEKQELFARCFSTLQKGGVFINADEHRPADTDECLAMLHEWSAHMEAAINDGRIPGSFRETFDSWHDRNIRRFGEPRKSGDDCHETIATQIDKLREAGFVQAETVWVEKLWAVVVAQKTTP